MEKFLNWLDGLGRHGESEMEHLDPAHAEREYPYVYVRPGDKDRGFYAEVVVYHPDGGKKQYDLNLGSTLTVDFSPPHKQKEN